MPLELSPLTESLPAERHPGAVYLARLAPTSRRSQRGALATCAELLAPGIALEEFPWHLLRYQHTAALRALVAARFAPATARRLLCAVRGVLREAWRLGLVDGEEYRRAVDLEPVEGTRLQAGRALTPAELSALHAATGAGPAGARDRALLALCYGCGLRRSEACSVTWEEISGGAVRVVGKGNREREVPCPPWTLVALREWRDACGSPETGPVLRRVGERGNPGPTLGATGAWSILSTLAERAGVEHLSPHDLRRTYVSALLDAGADLSAVQGLAGHSSPATTALYDRRGARARAAAAAKLPSP